MGVWVLIELLETKLEVDEPVDEPMLILSVIGIPRRISGPVARVVSARLHVSDAYL